MVNDAPRHHGTSVKDEVTNGFQKADPNNPRQPWEWPDSARAWEEVNKIVATYDEKMVGDWKEELGNLLIFVRYPREALFQSH